MPTQISTTTYKMGAARETVNGEPPYLTLTSSFMTVAATNTKDTYQLDITRLPYLGSVVANGLQFTFVKDATEVVSGTKVLTGATTNTAATNLSTALNAAGFTATVSFNVVTVSSTAALTVFVNQATSNIIVDHTLGVNQVNATGEVVINTPIDGDKLTIGSSVFELYSVMPYAGTNIGVLNSNVMATLVGNLKAAISTALPTIIVSELSSNKLLLSDNTADRVVSVTGISFTATQITGFVSPVTSVSKLNFETNAIEGDKIDVNNGVTQITVNMTSAKIGATPTATATLVATALTAAGFPSVAVAKTVTITYGAVYGAVDNEPSVTFLNMPTMTFVQTLFSSTGMQGLRSGAFAPYSTNFVKGQTVFALVNASSTPKKYSVVSYSVTDDTLYVIPDNGIMAVGNFTIIKLPPALYAIALSGGGITVAEETVDSSVKRPGLMTSKPLLTGFVYTASVETEMDMTPIIQELLASSIHSPVTYPSKSFALSGTLTKTATSPNGKLFTYTASLTSGASALNTASFGEHVVFILNGFAEKLKNNNPFTVSSLTANSFSFKSVRDLTPETADFTLTTATWFRNGVTPSTFTIGTFDGFEYISVSGCAPSGFDITSSGRDPVKITLPIVAAGEVSLNPRPTINGGKAFAPWIQMIPEVRGMTSFMASRSVAYINDNVLQITECAIKADSTASTNFAAPASDALQNDAGMSHGILSLTKVGPTGSFKIAMSDTAVNDYYSLTETGCPVSVMMRYEAVESCDVARKSRVLIFNIPTATAKKTRDPLVSDDTKYVAFELTGGETIVNTKLSKTANDNFAIQVSYFPLIQV